MPPTSISWRARRILRRPIRSSFGIAPRHVEYTRGDLAGERVMMNDRIGLQVRASAGPGVLHQLTGAIAQLRGDISSVEISSQGATEDLVNFEIDLPGSVDQLVRALQDLPVVRGVEVVDTLKAIYGKRIII